MKNLLYIKKNKKFVNSLIQKVFAIINGSLRSDHRILFAFYLGMMYQRGLGEFAEHEWKMFVNWNIDS